jgi:hypothetical protein
MARYSPHARLYIHKVYKEFWQMKFDPNKIASMFEVRMDVLRRDISILNVAPTESEVELYD